MNKDVLEQLREIYKEYRLENIKDTNERKNGEYESITDFIYYLVTNNYSVVKEAE